MSTIVWNARGLGGYRAFLLLKQLVADLKPLILFISESKVTCNCAYHWLNALSFAGVVGVDPQGTRGGLLLFWNKSVNVTLRSFSFSHIDASLSWESCLWRFTGCYAPSCSGERFAFWDLLLKLSTLKQSKNEPWILGGDFNDTLFESEKQGGN